MRLKWSMSSSSTRRRAAAARGARQRGGQLLVQVAAVEHAGERVGACQVVGLAARLLERLGLAPGGADGGLEHALERHLARHVGGDAVHDDAAVGAGGPGAERHPAGRAVEADDAHRVLGRLAVREPHQVALVGRAVVGMDGPRPGRDQIGAGGHRTAQDPLATGAFEGRADAAVGVDGVGVELVADRREQRVDRLGPAPGELATAAPKSRTTTTRYVGPPPSASGATVTTSGSRTPSARRPMTSCGTSPARSVTPGRNVSSARPVRSSSGTPRRRRAHRCRPGSCRRARSRRARRPRELRSTPRARSAAACSRRVYRRPAREG